MSFPVAFPDPFDSTLNWETVEDALRDWVVTASGYDQSRVWWADQKIPQGSTDFITLKINAVNSYGPFDEVGIFTNLSRAAGSEIEHRTKGIREIAVSIQAFTSQTVGNTHGRSVLAKVQGSLGLPGVRETLSYAGVSPIDAGHVTNVSAIAGTVFEGRAVLDCRFRCSETLSEYLGYIATVELVDLTGNDTMDL